VSVALRRAITIVVVLAVLAALVFAFLPEPVAVDLAAVSRGPMQVTVDEEGQTRIKERYVVSAPLAGRLRRIALDPGDVVEAGLTVVATIEPTDPQLLDARARAEAEARVRAAEAAVRQAGANLERVSAKLDFAENELARARDAFEGGGASEREVDELTQLHRIEVKLHRAAQFAEEIARFELEQARSALVHTNPDAELAEGHIQFRILAPITGRVLRVFQESVAVVSPGAPLLELGDPTDLELVIDVLSTDAVRIASGDEIVIEHWGGEEPLLASVRVVEPSAFTKVSSLGVEEQRVNVVADFVSPFDDRRTLGDGYRVEARIVLWREDDVLRVPTSAIFRHDEQWCVFAVEGERAVRRPVEIGRRNGLVAQVAGGLDAGDRVIVHPSDKVTDGTGVAPRGAS
jgi:HlyD family secretion protein